MMNQSAKDIIANGEEFVEELRTDKNGRYRSWEHCYSAFSQCKDKVLTDANADYLCLHLAFYLASWGMYRGSSKLLQKDYRVHASTVEELMKKEYIDLWSIQCKELLSTDGKLVTLFILRDKLQEIYLHFGVTPTDTLITKILMGTLGCAPAFDRYFKDGVKGKKDAHLVFNEKNMLDLSKYYVENSGKIRRAEKVCFYWWI